MGMSREGVQVGMWSSPALSGAGEGPAKLLLLILDTTLQGTCAPSEESSEESYKSKKGRKCDLHRKNEQTDSLERGRLINATDLTIFPAALTAGTVPVEGTSAYPQKAGVLSC